MEPLTQRNDVERVVFELGGKKRLAARIRVHTNTLRGWEKAGRIPAKYHEPLIAIGETIEVDIKRYL